jgi:mannosyltransferase OCH1-like enzyme
LVLWNEDNFNINSNQYVKEAYEANKYAFVTDYVRLYALYHQGGVYMDTDVEVLKSLDKFLEHRAFTGCENEEMCVTGIMAAEKGHKWIEDLLYDYNDKKFILPNGSYNKTPNTKIITEITINKFGWKPQNEHQVLKEGLNIYPFDFFCAKDWKTGEIYSNNNTYTIHHFSGSWYTKTDKFKNKIKNMIGPKGTQFVVKVKETIKGSLV